MLLVIDIKDIFPLRRGAFTGCFCLKKEEIEYINTSNCEVYKYFVIKGKRSNLGLHLYVNLCLVNNFLVTITKKYEGVEIILCQYRNIDKTWLTVMFTR